MKNHSPFSNNSLELAQLSRDLQEWGAGLGVFLTEEQLISFRRYYQELHFWNTRINLVASTEPAGEVFSKHFFDSLTLIPYLPVPDGRLLDIGTGGGFPGVPLRISLPRLQVTLLEASRKKVSFLKSLSRLLKLEGTVILQQRLEDLVNDDKYRNRFDVVVSRAALKLPEYLPMGKELISSSGLIFAMKGANYRADLAEVSTCLADWDLFLADVQTLCLPRTGDFRAILIFRKVQPPLSRGRTAGATV